MSDTDQLLPYPIVQHDDLTVDQVYLDLQQRGPVRIQLPYGEPCWVAARYDDVRTVYGDRRFLKGLGRGHDMPRILPLLRDDPSNIALMDAPQHTRIRRLTSGAFSVAQMRVIAGWVDDLLVELLDGLGAAGEPFDFVEAIAWPLPLRVLTGILGVDEADIPLFRSWIDAVMTIDNGVGAPGDPIAKLQAYVRARIDERRLRPADDLLSVMVRAHDDDDRLNEDELTTLTFILFLAGFETTAAQLGSVLFTLMSRRQLWEELVETPELLPTAIEELWRWIPSFRHGVPMIQWASEDIELSGGVVIPAGEAVVPEHQVANRDPAAFPHAAELDFHRVDPKPHLSLAWGPHRCLGAHLANLEIETVLRRLLERMPSLRLAVPADEVEWSPTTFLRSPGHLPLVV